MTELNIKGKDYKLKLTTRSCVDIEEKLGINPLNVFMEAADNKLPKLADLMIILHGCLLPLNHGITLDGTYDLYDDYCEEGGNLMSLIEVLVGCFTESGFIPENKKTKNGKN